MRAKLLQWIKGLEALSLRERILVVIGVPVVLLVAGEFLVFGPAATKSAQARKQTELRQSEVKALSESVAMQPAVAPLPGVDQLLRQRDELQGRIDKARAIVAGIDQTVDWGTVVRATVAGTPGLTLTKLKTMPAEVIFSPSMVKLADAQANRSRTAAAAAASAAATAKSAAQPSPGLGQIYRHRAELTINGEFSTLLGYLQTLQNVPGELHWDRLQLSVDSYPQASVQLTLFTLSNRAETPFN
jgi:MSHA biogenesis protein MshJ